MKIIIIGDSHDNIVNIRHILNLAKQISAQLIIHTGDWNSLRTFNELNDSGIEFKGVLGNADIDPHLITKLPTTHEFVIDGLKVGVIHDLTKSSKGFLLSKDIVFTGHLHKQKKWCKNGTVFVRPGSLEKELNFAIFDSESKTVKYIHE